MPDISRLYDFTPGTTIQSAQVDGEFNQLVNTVNALDGDNLIAAAAQEAGMNQTGVKRHGLASIAASELRASANYGYMATPDKVSGITVPSSGVLLVSYRAQMNSSGNVGWASLFVGGAQLGIAQAPGPPAAQETSWQNTTTVGYLFTHAGGLSNILHGAGDSQLASSGPQLIGAGQLGGWAMIELAGAAGGTVDVGVQFKGTNGAPVSVKNRVLRVVAVGF